MGLKLNNKKNNVSNDFNSFNDSGNIGMPNDFNNSNNSGKGPKIKREKLKNVSNNSKRNKVIGLLAVVIVVVLALNFISSYRLRDTVQIVTLISAVPQDGIIRTDNMQMSEMSAEEYMRRGVDAKTGKRAVITWDEREQINNTYASYYIRENTPIYLDSIGNETHKQYAYLYNMDGELLKISMDAGTFGQMLVPGDHINVRAAYSEQVYTLPTEEEFLLQQQTGISPQTAVRRQILLFNNVAVLDMLNSNGESIFDKYYELLALPKNKQLEMVQSEEFIEAVQPSEILLNVTPEEADRYMSIQSYGPSYMMTLLPRTSSNAITEVLNELQIGFARN